MYGRHVTSDSGGFLDNGCSGADVLQVKLSSLLYGLCTPGIAYLNLTLIWTAASLALMLFRLIPGLAYCMQATLSWLESASLLCWALLMLLDGNNRMT